MSFSLVNYLINLSKISIKFVRQIVLIAILTSTFVAAGTANAQTKTETKPAKGLTKTEDKIQSEPQTIPNSLKLDSKQKKMVAAIRVATIDEVKAVLTPAQVKLFEEGKKNNQKPKTIFKTLNLTTDQKSKISAIIQKNNEKIKAVLTPEQLKTLEKLKAEKLNSKKTK